MKRLHKKSESALLSTLTLSIILLSAVAVLLFYASPPFTQDQTLNLLLSAVIPRFFIAIFLLVVAVAFFPESLLSNRIPLKTLLWCILPLLVTVVNFPFSALIRGTAQVTRVELVWLFLIKCLLIGLGEELLFRGIIFHSLLGYFKKKKGALFWPVLTSAVIFALFHFVNLMDGAGILPVLQQVGYSFLIGAMLAIFLLQTRNLWLCVLLHALFDVGGFLIFDLGTGNPQDLTFWILTIIIGILCTAQMVWMLIKQEKKLLG